MKNIYIPICIAFYSLCWSQDDASTSLGLQLSANTITIGENAQSTFNTSENLGVVLTIAPQNNTTVKLSYDDSTEFTVVPDSIVFTPSNYNVEQNFTFTAVNDGIVDGSQTISIDVTASSFTHDSGSGDGDHDSGNGDGSHDSGNGDGSHDSGNGDGSHDSGNGDGSHDSGNGDGSHDSGNGDGSHDSGNGDGTTDIEESLTLTVTVLDFDNTLNLSEISLDKITAYPNPVQNNNINISGLTSDYTATVYDLTGKTYSVTKISPNNNTIEIRDIPTGLLILKIHDQKNSKVFSIIKK
jgi:hypothetical protein